MPAPPVMTLSDASFSPTAAPEGSIQDSFDMGNTGAGPLDYDFYVDYVGVIEAGSTYHENDFNTGIGYTASGWATYAGGTWNDGTDCANAADAALSVMTSDPFNTISGGDKLWLEFRYGTDYKTGSSLVAEYWNGTSWVEIWRLEASGVGTAKVELARAADTQVRFTAVSTRVQGSWSIERLDNIKVYSDDIPYQWCLFEIVDASGQPDMAGTIAASGSETFNLDFNATGLAEGTYNADIVIYSNYTPETVKNLPVVFTVTGGSAPDIPDNIIIGLPGLIDWDDSAGATSYDIYVSDDPYGTFTFLINVTASEYTIPIFEAKKFFYIVAKN